MEENKELIESKNNELNEDQLDEVAGGDVGVMGEDDACWFEPEQPIKHSEANGTIYVKCKSRCNRLCGCHGSMYCVDRWHLAEQDKIIMNKWYPLPKNMYNHSGIRKIIEPLNIT